MQNVQGMSLAFDQMTNLRGKQYKRIPPRPQGIVYLYVV